MLWYPLHVDKHILLACEAIICPVPATVLAGMGLITSPLSLQYKAKKNRAPTHHGHSLSLPAVSTERGHASKVYTREKELLEVLESSGLA